MKLRPTRRAALAAGAAVVLVPSVAFATTSSIGTGAGLATKSSGLELVQSGITAPGGGGTDLEFFSRTLSSFRDADGATVTPEAPVERHFAIVGNQKSGAKIVDITDPAARSYEVAGLENCTVGQGDVQVTKDGMLAAIAFQTSGSCETVDGDPVKKGSVIVHLSDVYAPKVVAGAPEAAGAHNNTLTPDGRYLYISTSGIAEANAKVPIYDLADPANPRLVTTFTAPGNSPHDIRFSDDGKRAYLAGISQYRILDTSDPEKPVLLSTFAPPGGSIGHDTLITPDRTFLFVGDEGGGGGTYPCPGGAIYVYDVRDDRPVLLGLAEAAVGPVTGREYNEAGAGRVGACTAHVMDLNPDKKSLTIGWYGAGTRVFDFSGLYNADGTPKTAPALAYGPLNTGIKETAYIVPEVDGNVANTWSAKQYSKVPGYVFSDDLNLGLYVSKIAE